MAKTPSEITKKRFRVIKQWAHKPDDDRTISKIYGVSLHTAQQIRLSKNYHQFKKRLKPKKKKELSMITRLPFIDYPMKKVKVKTRMSERSNRLDQESMNTSRMLGWMMLFSFAALVALMIWGVIILFRILTAAVG